MRTKVAVIMLAGLLGFARLGSAEPPGSQAAADQTAPEADFLRTMGLDNVKQVIYRDVDGAATDYAAFMSKVKRQHVMPERTIDPDTGIATFRITTKPTVTLDSLIHPSLAVPVGGELPVLEHADLHGRTPDLRDGKHYSLLSFYFSECAPCIQEIPELNALKEQAPNLQVLSITFDDKPAARLFVEQRGLRWPVVGDAQDFIDALGVQAYPALVAVSPDGRLVGSRSAYVVSDDKDKQLAQLKDWLVSLGVKM